MTKTATNFVPTLDIVNDKLQTVIQAKQDHSLELQELFTYAQQYATQPGMKITRAKDGLSSQIVDNKGNRFVTANSPYFHHSAMNIEGEIYVMLHETTIYSQLHKGTNSSRGLRRGKLAMNSKGEIFFMKIYEHEAGEVHNKFLQREALPEASLSHEILNAPHANPTLREKGSTIKTYVLTPFTGVDVGSFFKEAPLSGLDALEIVIQQLQLIFFLRDKGIVHRDIKPQNYTVYREEDASLRVSLVDCGGAKKMNRFPFPDSKDHGYFFSSDFYGTKNYFPPCHQAQSPNAPHQYIFNTITDLYSGAVSVIKQLNSFKTNHREAVDKMTIREREIFKEILTLAEKIQADEVFKNPYFSSEGNPLPPQLTNVAQIEKKLHQFSIEVEALRAIATEKSLRVKSSLTIDIPLSPGHSSKGSGEYPVIKKPTKAGNTNRLNWSGSLNEEQQPDTASPPKTVRTQNRVATPRTTPAPQQTESFYSWIVRLRLRLASFFQRTQSPPAQPTLETRKIPLKTIKEEASRIIHNYNKTNNNRGGTPYPQVVELHRNLSAASGDMEIKAALANYEATLTTVDRNRKEKLKKLLVVLLENRNIRDVLQEKATCTNIEAKSAHSLPKTKNKATLDSESEQRKTSKKTEYWQIY